MMQRRSRWWTTGVGLGLLLLVGALTARAQSLEERVDLLEQAFKTSEWTFRPYWKNDLRFETLNKQILIRIGGRLQFDMNFFLPGDDMEDAFGDPEDRFFFRRARLFVRGTLYKFIQFKAEYSFQGGEVEPEDLYLRFVKIPVIGNFFVGKFKAPFGLEELTSSRFITFQERSLTDPFVAGRELGFMIANDLVKDRLFGWVSLTRRPDDSGFGTESDDLNVTLRLAGTPLYAQNGRRVVHLGGAYRFVNPTDDAFRLRARPEARIDSLSFVDTETIADVSAAHIFGAEAAAVIGSLSLQGEFMTSLLEADAASSRRENDIEDLSFYAFYVMASFFLTGEHRPYDGGDFGRPKPHRNFPHGPGAFEVALRYSMVNLDDVEDLPPFDPTIGGQQSNLTFGVNWYPNPNTRVTLNYVHGFVDERLVNRVALDDDGFGVVMMRFQADF